MEKEKDVAWYASWFDTPYYHILYKDRDYHEAGIFMQNLTSYLNLKKESHLLDVACGKGRHSKYLNKLGYTVTGIDLSPLSIEHAKKFENDSLTFKVQDMCIPLAKKFDAVLNLFTSFGYFEKEEQNLAALKAFKAQLKPNGYGVIDFLNSNWVIDNLVNEEVKKIDNITFRIKRTVDNGYIVKNISFKDKGIQHQYTEKVKALTLPDFKEYLKESGCSLVTTFGDYHLQKFDKEQSQRLILIFN